MQIHGSKGPRFHVVGRSLPHALLVIHTYINTLNDKVKCKMDENPISYMRMAHPDDDSSTITFAITGTTVLALAQIDLMLGSLYIIRCCVISGQNLEKNYPGN